MTNTAKILNFGRGNFAEQERIEFGFWLDSAASDKNALCAHWLTEADDALNSEWISHGAIWNNPPYSNIRPWVEKAAEQFEPPRFSWREFYL
ncbi:hypothetical protein AML62_20790 [Escherichia coli]|nr:hypothetical protein AML62_20790 [Escherichia coli]